MTTEKKPHKHADILRAIADGDVVQFSEYNDDTWVDRQDDSNAPDPITHDFYEWRIKPEVKPDIVRYAIMQVTDFGSGIACSGRYNSDDEQVNMKLAFDYETGKLKSAEVI
ncbi:hypothetical protein P26059A_0107 [Curvibacter phage P26059A]|nr:hypothetical protein P26059A_0107 [Curvibacter phage P26059A]